MHIRVVSHAPLLVALPMFACGGGPSPALGTADQRAALFDYIIERTETREAFSPAKQEALGFDPLEEMARLRDDVVSAASEEELFYALVRLSNARRDRHLDVALVSGGLELADSAAIAVAGDDTERLPHHAPIKMQTDYGDDAHGLFVSDVADGWDDRLQVGDRVLAVNGYAVKEYRELLEPYIRYSSTANLLWRFAEMVPQRTAELPASFYEDGLGVELERGNERFTMSLPYLHPDSITWTDVAEPRYDGFTLERVTQTYDLHVSTKGLPAIVLGWHGFRENLLADVDSLMAWAVREDRLDHAVIIDATRSRGGSAGAYAVQRFTAKPFKTTFGNLRISDVIPPFIAEKRADFEANQIDDGGVRETVDDGTWLMDWLETDVQAAYDAGAEYSNDVPFKLAHAPRASDGILVPAPVHFRGPMVVFSGPRRGSHLDQFVSIVVDNDLGHVIGMPAGGYSNTWEWEETLVFPGTEQPVAQFMWSIGHTIRPNGEILEGNAAAVHEFIPVTRENFRDYYSILLRRALVQLGLRE